MKIKINRPVEVEPATMKIYLKVRDEFNFELVDTNGNWRMTFTFENGDAILVDYQDYH